jgi:hypothetical protein
METAHDVLFAGGQQEDDRGRNLELDGEKEVKS